MPRSLSLRASGVLAGVALLALPLGAAAPASAAPAAKTYRNCAAIHAVYSGGIAKAGVTSNRTPHGNRSLKGRVKFSNALYAANTKSDRDKDGIACELA